MTRVAMTTGANDRRLDPGRGSHGRKTAPMTRVATTPAVPAGRVRSAEPRADRSTRRGAPTAGYADTPVTPMSPVHD